MMHICECSKYSSHKNIDTARIEKKPVRPNTVPASQIDVNKRYFEFSFSGLCDKLDWVDQG